MNKKLMLYSILSFLVFMSALLFHSFMQSKQTEAATTKETYLITRTGSHGIEGTAKDNTGVYIAKEDLNGLEVYTGDLIKVTFADYETILKVEKVN